MDRREQILIRLLAIAAGLVGENSTARNVVAIDEDSANLPAIVLLDGDESAIDDDPQRRPSPVKRKVEMSPVLHIVMGSRPENIGSALNAVRAELIKAVVTDQQLMALVDTTRFGIRYDGMESARNEQGRLVVGQQFVRFTFTYMLIPAEL